MAIQKLLFVDTNIWLDFYRNRTEISLKLLEEIEKISSRVIVTYQLESEFKRNRQRAILEGMQELKAPSQIPRLGIFSDARETANMGKSLKTVEKNVKNLKVRLRNVLANPAANDPVYQACQRIFHRDGDPLILTRSNKVKHRIRSLAFKRFLHGCPPRKSSDLTIGDAINWEWMVHCANVANAELVIVSRDTDYGVTFEGVTYVNDHLRQEFSDRVSRKRKLLLYNKISEALAHFKIPVPHEVTAAEADLFTVDAKTTETLKSIDWTEFSKKLEAELKKVLAPSSGKSPEA